MNPILANVGVPMLLVQMPLLFLALPVIIVIEAILCRLWLAVSWRQAFKGAGIANVVSTMAGFPLLWFAWLAVQILVGGTSTPKLSEPWFSVYTVTVQAAWLLPFEDRLYWMIPTACIVLLIPAFFITVFIEKRLYGKFFRASVPVSGVSAATWRMHLITYGLLFITGFWLLGREISRHKPEPVRPANLSQALPSETDSPSSAASSRR